MKRVLFCAAVAALCACLLARPSTAGIVVGLVLDPFAESSSDLGNWQLFAVDDSSTDFGISTYNIDLVGATTIHNASPFASGIQDADGNTYQAGFNLLRSPSGLPNGDTIHAAQSLPDQSPFLITGMGQESGDFASKIAAAQSGATVLPGGSASSWGNYSTISPLNGKNWLLLADGNYNRSAPPTIAQASFTVFSNSKTFQSSFSQAAIVPEPITPTLLTPDYLAHLAPPTVTPPIAPPTPVPPVGGPVPPIAPPTPVPPSGGPVSSTPPVGGTAPPNSHLNGNGIVVGMVLNPAAAGAQNTWQLFAVDTNANDFGISSFNVNVSGATSIRHTSPTGQAMQDADGNAVEGGFNLLRGIDHIAGSDWIHASQGLPGQGSMLITGFGQEASGFAAKASAQPGATALSHATWGNYDGLAPLDGKNWLLLADGTYDPAAPPKIGDATFTVFSDPTTFRSSFSSSTVVPDPITPALLTPEYLATIGPPPPPAPVTPATPTTVVPPASSPLDPVQTVMPPAAEQQPPIAPPQPETLPEANPPQPIVIIEPPLSGTFKTPADQSPASDPPPDWSALIPPESSPVNYPWIIGDPIAPGLVTTFPVDPGIVGHLLIIDWPVIDVPLVGYFRFNGTSMNYDGLALPPGMTFDQYAESAPHILLTANHDGLYTNAVGFNSFSAPGMAFAFSNLTADNNTPEPGSVALLIIGQFILVVAVRRRRV